MTNEQNISIVSPHRRIVMKGLLAAAASLACSSGMAQAESGNDRYFFPGSRIGIMRPGWLRQSTNLWQLSGQFGTFSASVQESIPFDQEPHHLWDRDKRYILVPGQQKVDRMETRHFHTRMSGSNENFAEETLVLRDGSWIGALKVNNRPLGTIRDVQGGMHPQWRQVMQAILASVEIRAPLPIDQILSEIGIGLAAPELNPRLIGETLIFSTYAPANAEESWGANYPNIRSSSVLILPPGTPQEQADLNTQFEAMLLKAPGAKALTGPACRGVLRPEHEITHGTFARSMDVFGQTRSLTLSAFYDDGRRREMNEALLRLLQTIRLA